MDKLPAEVVVKDGEDAVIAPVVEDIKGDEEFWNKLLKDHETAPVEVNTDLGKRRARTVVNYAEISKGRRTPLASVAVDFSDPIDVGSDYSDQDVKESPDSEHEFDMAAIMGGQPFKKSKVFLF